MQKGTSTLFTAKEVLDTEAVACRLYADSNNILHGRPDVAAKTLNLVTRHSRFFSFRNRLNIQLYITIVHVSLKE